MKAISINDIIKATKGTIINCDNNKIITSITTDSRKIEKGCLFIPIIGQNFDGHDFIEQAFEKGAICCLSSKKDNYSKNIIYVKDTKKALGDIARFYRGLFDVKICAITGSVGKTTTKDIIASVLSQKYKTLKTQGNFNNDIGLPLTIFNINEEHEAVVLEMGMNNFGEISYLTNIAKPDVAVITNVGVSHIENLGSREGILKAKCEIFEGLKSTAILNADDDMLINIKNDPNFIRFNKIWFGTNDSNDFYVDNIIDNGIEGISCTIHNCDKYFDVNMSTPGKHMVLNALAAAAVGTVFGVEAKDIKKGIECFLPTGMRMEISKIPEYEITLINDSYNANPVSTMASIDVLAKSNGLKTAILGDMFELGSFAPTLHYNVGKYAAKNKIDNIICIGELSLNMYKGAMSVKDNGVYYYNNIEEFFKAIEYNMFLKGQTVLIKASHGMAFSRIADRLRGGI